MHRKVKTRLNKTERTTRQGNDASEGEIQPVWSPTHQSLVLPTKEEQRRRIADACLVASHSAKYCERPGGFDLIVAPINSPVYRQFAGNFLRVLNFITFLIALPAETNCCGGGGDQNSCVRRASDAYLAGYQRGKCILAHTGQLWSKSHRCGYND